MHKFGKTEKACNEASLCMLEHHLTFHPKNFDPTADRKRLNSLLISRSKDQNVNCIPPSEDLLTRQYTETLTSFGQCKSSIESYR